MADIFLDLKLVFMHNPKCGSRNLRSIAKQMLQQRQMKYIGGTNQNKLLISMPNRTYYAENVFTETPPKELDFTYEHCHARGIYRLLEHFQYDPKEFSFLYVIRHPLKRLLSGFRYEKKRGTLPPDFPFADYVYRNHEIAGVLPLNLHVMNHFSLIDEKTFHINQLVKLESFESGMKKILTSYGFDSRLIDCNGWQNSSADYRLPPDITFTDQMLKFVKNHWQVDIRMGKYDLSF